MNNPANTKASGQSGNELIAHHMWCGGREKEKTLSTAVAGPQIAGERPRVGYRGLAKTSSRSDGSSRLTASSPRNRFCAMRMESCETFFIERLKPIK